MLRRIESVDEVVPPALALWHILRVMWVVDVNAARHVNPLAPVLGDRLVGRIVADEHDVVDLVGGLMCDLHVLLYLDGRRAVVVVADADLQLLDLQPHLGKGAQVARRQLAMALQLVSEGKDAVAFCEDELIAQWGVVSHSITFSVRFPQHSAMS